MSRSWEVVIDLVMKKTYHLCLSSDEVMFRDEEDYNRGFNAFALALYKTDSVGLVESIMSTHAHMLVQTHNPNAFMGAFRMPYTKYFNSKYSRSGPLGEQEHFTMEVKGLHHHLAAMSYILRNGLHHGVAPIPFAYPHCSVNVIFQREMGKRPEQNLLPAKSFYRFIGRNADVPDNYKMSASGLILRESVLDIPQVENMFVTPRNFDYYMNRRTSEEWIKEQERDRNGERPVTLELIESKVGLTKIDEMLIYESGRADYRRMTDVQVCDTIDKIVKDEFHRPSVYLLSIDEKLKIVAYLRQNYHLPIGQISRCLVLDLDDCCWKMLQGKG